MSAETFKPGDVVGVVYCTHIVGPRTVVKQHKNGNLGIEGTARQYRPSGWAAGGTAWEDRGHLEPWENVRDKARLDRLRAWLRTVRADALSVEQLEAIRKIVTKKPDRLCAYCQEIVPESEISGEVCNRCLDEHDRTPKTTERSTT